MVVTYGTYLGEESYVGFWGSKGINFKEAE
jgi:hypothetical protein